MNSAAETTQAEAPRPEDEARRRLWERIGLPALLSGIALVVSVARLLEMHRINSFVGAAGVEPRWFINEAALWFGWTLWAAALVALIRSLVERPAARGRRAAALVAYSLAPIVLVPVVASPIHWQVVGAGSLLRAWLHMVQHNALLSLLLGATMAGVAHGYFTLHHARRLELVAARLGAQLTAVQLDTLRAQLDPHFLFNALNSVAVLARRGDGAQVEQMVARLAGLLRHSLDSARSQLVTLGVECAALRHYLEIEQVRHADRLQAVVDVPAVLEAWLVPSFLLQPLAENAIRHGFDDPGRVLQIAVRAAAEGGRLTITVRDDGAGIASRGTGEGVGLGNTRARLEGLYGGAASLDLAAGENGRGTIVTIVLPAAPEPAA